MGASEDEGGGITSESQEEAWWNEVEVQITLEEVFERDIVKRQLLPDDCVEMRPHKAKKPG